MIAMRESDGVREAIRNHASLFVPVRIVDSTDVQLTGYLKSQPTQHLSISLSFGGMLKAQPSWNAAKSGPLWHCKALSLR